MCHLQWYDYLRMVTMVLALMALYFSGRRAFRHWKNYTSRYRQLWWCFNVLLFLLFEGSMEQIILDLPWGPRTLLGFMVAFASLVAVTRKEDSEKS